MGKRRTDKVGCFVDTSTTWHPGCEACSSDESSSEPDSAEQRRMEEYKRAALQRIEEGRAKSASEDLQMDDDLVDTDGTDFCPMEHEVNLPNFSPPADSEEKQLKPTKSSRESNPRIRWLEAKLKDVDTTLDLIASNRKRKMKCCRHGCHESSGEDNKDTALILDVLVKEALDAGFDITTLPSYKEFRDSCEEVPVETKCEGNATIFCHDCMGFFCNVCHVDYNATHDVAVYSSDVSFRKGFLNFPGYQTRAIIGEHKGRINYLNRCECDDHSPRVVSRNFLDTGNRIKTIEISYCQNCDDLDCILDFHGYVASGYAWAISKRAVASIRDCEGNTLGGVANVINATNQDIGRKVKQERLQDAINWDTQLTAHLEASSKNVLPSVICKCCQIPHLDPCCIEIKPRELITDGTPIQRHTKGSPVIPENAIFPLIAHANEDRVKDANAELFEILQDAGSTAKSIVVDDQETSTELPDDIDMGKCTPGASKFVKEKDVKPGGCDWNRGAAVVCDHNFIFILLMLQDPGERAIAFLVAFLLSIEKEGVTIDPENFLMDDHCHLVKQAKAALLILEKKYSWWRTLVETLQAGAFHRINHKWLCQLQSFFQKDRCSVTGDVVEATMGNYRPLRKSLYHMMAVSYFTTLSNTNRRANMLTEARQFNSRISALKDNDAKILALRKSLRKHMRSCFSIYEGSDVSTSKARLSDEEYLELKRNSNLIGRTELEDRCLLKIMSWPMKAFIEPRKLQDQMKYVNFRLQLDILLKKDVPIPEYFRDWILSSGRKRKADFQKELKKSRDKFAAVAKRLWKIKKNPNSMDYSHDGIKKKVIYFLGMHVIPKMADMLLEFDADSVELTAERKKKSGSSSGNKAVIQNKMRSNRKDVARLSDDYQKAYRWVQAQAKSVGVEFAQFHLLTRSSLAALAKDEDLRARLKLSRESNCRWMVFQTAHFLYSRKKWRLRTLDSISQLSQNSTLHLHHLLSLWSQGYELESLAHQDDSIEFLERDFEASKQLIILENEIQKLMMIWDGLLSIKPRRLNEPMRIAIKLFSIMKKEYSENLRLTITRAEIFQSFQKFSEDCKQTSDEFSIGESVGEKRNLEDFASESKRSKDFPSSLHSVELGESQTYDTISMRKDEDLDAILVQRQQRELDRLSASRLAAVKAFASIRDNNSLTSANKPALLPLEETSDEALQTANTCTELILRMQYLTQKSDAESTQTQLEENFGKLSDEDEAFAQLEESCHHHARNMNVLAGDLLRIFYQGLTAGSIGNIFNVNDYAGDEVGSAMNRLFCKKFTEIGGWESCSISISSEILSQCHPQNFPSANLQHCGSTQHFTNHGWLCNDLFQGLPIIEYSNSQHPCSSPGAVELRAIRKLYAFPEGDFFIRSWAVHQQRGPSCFFRSCANTYMLLVDGNLTHWRFEEKSLREWVFICLKNGILTDPRCHGRHVPNAGDLTTNDKLFKMYKITT